MRRNFSSREGDGDADRKGDGAEDRVRDATGIENENRCRFYKRESGIDPDSEEREDTCVMAETVREGDIKSVGVSRIGPRSARSASFQVWHMCVS